MKPPIDERAFQAMLSEIQGYRDAVAEPEARRIVARCLAGATPYGEAEEDIWWGYQRHARGTLVSERHRR